MTLATVLTRAQLALEAPLVRVEVHCGAGLPQLTVVGLAETSVRESRERVRAALAQGGFEFPAGRVTVNLAPADLPKEGGRYDLAVALGPSNLLVRALGDRLDQYLESAVRLAALVFPHRQVVNAYNRFVDGDAKTRPYAIELLEHTIEDLTLSRRLGGVLDR